MGKKQSIEDQILSNIIKLFLAPFKLFAYTALGFFAPIMIPLGPIVGSIYFVIKGRLDQKGAAGNSRPHNRMAVPSLRGAVVGTAIALALLAPTRGLAFLVAKFSGIGFLHEFFTTLSLNGVVDAWMGLTGVVLTTLFGFAAWQQGLRIKTQIENIPTAKAHSAALGLAEFKGVAREIADESKRMTEIKVNVGQQPTVSDALGGEAATMPILYERWIDEVNRVSKMTEIRSRFYLEDDSGRILVDPRTVWFWNGKIQYFSPSARSIYLENRFEKRSREGTTTKIRRLDPGDEIYVIGSVDELEDAVPTATESERLVVRPSSVLKSTNLLHRIVLGKGKQDQRTDIYDVFFLTDVKESKAGEILTQGLGKIWLWVGATVGLSIPLLVEFWGKLFDWRTMLEFVLNLLGF